MEKQIESYLQYKNSQHYSDQTLYKTKHHLNRFNDFLQQVIVNYIEVDSVIVESYHKYLTDFINSQNNKLGHDSLYRHLITLKGFYEYLQFKNLILFNPVNNLVFAKARYSLPKEILSLEDAKKLLGFNYPLTILGQRDKAIILTLLTTGLRNGEMLRLKINDIDWIKNRIMIRKSKFNKDRLIPVKVKTLENIQTYLSLRKNQKYVKLISDYVFTSRSKRPLEKRNLVHIIDKALVQVAITKPGGAVTFRHFVATTMLENGCDIRYIQDFLGHESLETTKIYTRVSIPTLKKIHQKTHPRK